MKSPRGSSSAARALFASCLAIGASFLALPRAAAQAEWSGSFGARTGAVFQREGIPDAAMQDWLSRLAGTVRLRGGEGSGRFACEAWGSLDPSTGTWSLSLDEAWGQWSPLGWMSFRLGRSRLSFGPCLAFSPANSFQDRDPFDARSGKTGLDGLQSEFRPLEAFLADPPLGLSLQADFVLPPASAAAPASALPDLEESSGRTRLVLLFPECGILAQTELGLSGDLRDLGREERPWAAGGWLSADLGGFVLGAEGSLRSGGYAEGLSPGEGEEEIEAAFGASRKLGDFYLAAEGRWSSADDGWQGFFRAAFSRGDLSLSGTILADFEAQAARSALEISWNASDALVMGACLAWNYRPEAWDDPVPLAAVGSASVSAEWYY